MTDRISAEVNDRVQSTEIDNIWFDSIDHKYYFSTESYDLEGPYDTIREANEALGKYCEWLNKPKGD